ncbi:MAG: NAD-dependent epimerase/dehydratase family protein, partial [bacterium]|nr:NAD-dependent epimerase/dehydratase family protein [bacterium]
LRDVRKTPPRNKLHFFEGKIEQVDSFKIAVLGTDSAIGKRTTAWMLVDGLRNAGYSAELIGTGQTAWMQGAHYSLMLDSLINDFLTGEIEHAVWSAWNDLHPDFIVIEGQGSLLNPAYPGGYEILAAARPDAVILQHAPTRRTYDGFPNYPIQPLEKQITAIEMVSEKPVIAIAINHEGLSQVEIPIVCRQINQQTTLPAVDVLVNGATEIVSTILQFKTESSKNEKTKAT